MPIPMPKSSPEPGNKLPSAPAGGMNLAPAPDTQQDAGRAGKDENAAGFLKPNPDGQGPVPPSE